MTTDKERFEATAREIISHVIFSGTSGGGYTDLEQLHSRVSSALSSAFEDGRKAGAEQERAVWELSRINQELGIE